MRPREGRFDRLDTAVEHAQVLAGVVIGEVLAQIPLGAGRGDFFDHCRTARAQLDQLGLERLEAGRGHRDAGIIVPGRTDRFILSGAAADYGAATLAGSLALATVMVTFLCCGGMTFVDRLVRAVMTFGR